MSNNDNNDDYDVGYGKPPKNTRFGAKDGNPRNQKGRPKIPNTLEEEAQAVFKAKIGITLNGRKTKISRRQALMEVIVNGAINGDARMMRLAIPLSKLADNAPEMEVLPEDEMALKRLLENMSDNGDGHE